MRESGRPGLVLISLAIIGSAAAQAPAGGANPAQVAGSAEQILKGDAARAGDDDLTCDQIGEQMQSMFDGMEDMSTMLSSAARADEEIRRSQAEIAARTAVEAPVIMAQSAAEAALAMNPAAAAVGGMAANQAAAAMAQAQLAKAAQGGQAGNAALQAYRQSAANLVSNNTDELTRMRRLMELSEQKGCGPPPGMPAGGYEDDEEVAGDESHDSFMGLFGRKGEKN